MHGRSDLISCSLNANLDVFAFEFELSDALFDYKVDQLFQLLLIHLDVFVSLAPIDLQH